MRAFRMPLIVIGTALIWPLCSMAQLPEAKPASTTLQALVESAWQRAPIARTLEARQEETAASRELARSWLAAAPTLGLSERSDRWADNRGQRETEVSLASQVVLPGQRKARETFAARSSEDLSAQLALARLTIAGEVRNRLWEAAAAQELLLEKQDHLHHLEELAQEVAGRVKAGDLARSDGLLAQQEVLAAQGDVARARTKASEAMARFRLLTGAATLPIPEMEALPQESAGSHLRLRAAQAAEQNARAALALAKASASGSPTVALSMRRERASDVAGADRSIGIGLQIPLGTQARNRPAEALAGTQLATAAAEAARAHAAVDAESALARDELANAREALEAATARATAMHEHTTLIDKAFRQGERGLAELLRSQALTHEADVAVRQQRIALGMAHAHLNQALGILP